MASSSKITEMNDIRDIVLKWHNDDFDCETEKMLFLLKYGDTLKEEYWDMMPMGGSIREHPWDKYDD